MKGPTAYFLFCEEHREAEKARLLSESGGKVSVAEVAKSLGQRWKALSEDEKQKYKTSAQERAQQNHQTDKAPAEGTDDADPQEQEAAEKKKGPDVLPVTVLKRIIMADSEMGRVSHDALVLTAACADFFLNLLAKKLALTAKKHKRRTVKLDDFEDVIKTDKRLALIGLRDVVASVSRRAQEEKDAIAEESKENEGQDAAQQQGGKKQKVGTVPTAARIDSFFAKQVT